MNRQNYAPYHNGIPSLNISPEVIPEISHWALFLPVAGWGFHVVGNHRVRNGPAAGSCPRVIRRRIKLLLSLPPSYCRRRRRNDRSAIAAIRRNVGNTLGLKEFLVICFISPTASQAPWAMRENEETITFFVNPKSKASDKCFYG